jgi:glycosyltransferase involved in cell wall biosynthesis
MTHDVASSRLLLATETYWPEIGGGERQARTMATGMAELGREVTILTRRSRRELLRQDQDGPARVVRLPPAGIGRWRKWLLLLPAFLCLCARRKSYDVVLVSGFRILGIAAVMARAVTGRPTILKGDSRGELSGEYFRAGISRAGLKADSWMVSCALRIRNALLSRADAFVALSEEMASEYRNQGVPASRVWRIPNGVDTGCFRPASADERRELRNTLCLPGEVVAVYTGRLVTYKGLRTLLRAWCSVRNVTLVLVGEEGADVHGCERELREFAAAHALEQRVIFAGPSDRVEDWLRAADLFLFPTENEAFGLSLVEAMACALPCITTSVGGLRDFVVDGANAWVVPTGDHDALSSAVSALAADAGRRKALGDAARQTALQRFSMRVVVGAYAECIDALIRSRAARAP